MITKAELSHDDYKKYQQIISNFSEDQCDELGSLVQCNIDEADAVSDVLSAIKNKSDQYDWRLYEIKTGFGKWLFVVQSPDEIMKTIDLVKKAAPDETMYRVAYFCQDRDIEELFIPVIEGLYKNEKFFVREVLDDAVLRGYHELVCDNEHIASLAKASMNALCSFHHILCDSSQEIVNRNVAYKLVRHFLDNVQ